MEQTFNILKRWYGSHKAASRALFVSYTRYNEWRWHPERIPEKSRHYLELAAKQIETKQALDQERSVAKTAQAAKQ